MNAAHHLTYLQAVVIGLIQGLTELFPVSSLGHTVLIPSWLGGSWAALVRQEDSAESPYLAFIVGLHLATALVLIGYYWREWLRLARGLVTSVARRQVETPEQRLAWLIVIATIPVGLAGLTFEHAFRVLFARPDAAAVFLMINGGILLLGERYRRRGRIPAPGGRRRRHGRSGPGRRSGRRSGCGDRDRDHGHTRGRGPGAARSPPPRPGRTQPERAVVDAAAEQRLAGLGAGSALWIGAAQILALFAGISREGVTMAGGLVRGLSHEDALALRVPAVHPGDPGRGGTEGSRPHRAARRRHPGPGAGRQRGRRRHVAAGHRLSGPLVPHPHAHAVRGLLPGRRPAQPDPLHDLVSQAVT